MIDFFLGFYPDELVYSFVARYAELVRYFWIKYVYEDLFGRNMSQVYIDLPCNLDQFVAHLPVSARITVDHIIDHHTLFPYYAPFMLSEQAASLREAMHTGNITNLYYLGNSKVRATVPLRTCPRCVEDDRGQFGETYWHRIHQCRGVVVCPIHETSLVNIFRTNQAVSKRARLKSAEEALLDGSGSESTDASRPAFILIDIARDAQWLLEHPETVHDVHLLLKKYRVALDELGIVTTGGRVATSRLADEFVRWCQANQLEPSDFAPELHGYRCWLNYIARDRSKQRPAQQHLLFIHFLGKSVDRILTEELVEFCPFGKGPWPCLNLICKSIQKPVIETCIIKRDRRKTTDRVHGQFECPECGYTYIHLRKYFEDGAIKERIYVVRYGAVWEKAFQELWQDSRMTIQAIAKQLKVDPSTVVGAARRLSILDMRPGFTLSPSAASTPVRLRKDVIAKIADRRLRWIDFLENHPDLTVGDLQEQYPDDYSLYSYLRVKDRDWLKAHRPGFRKPRTEDSQESLYDQVRDASLAAQILSASDYLRGQPGKLMRITINSIGRHIGSPDWLRLRLDEFPLASAELSRVIESPEDFTVRRIEWVAQQYLSERYLPPRSTFIQRASLHYWMRKSQRVCEALDVALQMLANTLGYS